MNSIPAPLASTISPAFPDPGPAASGCPPEPSDPAQPETRNPELETPEGPSIADAIRNGARPHVAPRRHHDHWTDFRHRVARPTLFEKDVVNDMYETIHRYGLSDTSAARNFDVDSISIDSWKQADAYLLEFFEIARAKFELDQVHKVESSTRKDGTADPSPPAGSSNAASPNVGAAPRLEERPPNPEPETQNPKQRRRRRRKPAPPSSGM